MDLADARNLLASGISHWELSTLALIWATGIEARGLGGESGTSRWQTAGVPQTS